MTDKITRLQELSDKATPAPWEVVPNSWAITTIYAPNRQGIVCELNMGEVDEQRFNEIEPTQEANATIIATTRNELPALLALVKRQHEALTRLLQNYEMTTQDYDIGKAAITAYNEWNEEKTNDR